MEVTRELVRTTHLLSQISTRIFLKVCITTPIQDSYRIGRIQHRWALTVDMPLQTSWTRQKWLGSLQPSQGYPVWRWEQLRIMPHRSRVANSRELVVPWWAAPAGMGRLTVICMPIAPKASFRIDQALPLWIQLSRIHRCSKHREDQTQDRVHS